MKITSYQQVVDAIHKRELYKIKRINQAVQELRANQTLPLNIIKVTGEILERNRSAAKEIELDHFKASVADAWHPTACKCGRLIGHGCSR